ncbi:hypothetical protein MMC09_003901 [Bachmanniomyces sp. S44760]|nr:hypothetical protein [Bachmanniomyces sp. S44760]
MPSQSAHAGGYSEVTVAKVRCKLCKKVKGIQSYSKKQQNDLRYKILQFKDLNSVNAAQIKCRSCVGGQNTEMTCCMCDEVKGLEDFAKAQRRHPDMARCTACVGEHLAFEPGIEELVRVDEGEESDGKTNPYTGTTASSLADPLAEGGVAIPPLTAGNLSSLRSQTGFSGSFDLGASRIASSTAHDNESTVDPRAEAWNSFAGISGTDTGEEHVWTTRFRKEGHDKIPTAYTGYDSKGVAHPRFQVASTAASDTTSIAPSRSDFSKVKNEQKKFPKPAPGYKKPAPAPKHTPSRNMSVPHEDDEEDEDEDFFTI